MGEESLGAELSPGLRQFRQTDLSVPRQAHRAGQAPIRPWHRILRSPQIQLGSG